MVPDTAAYRADINCNGVTQDIPIEWKFMDDSHLKVLLTPLATGVSAPLVLGSDYTVTGAGSDDGGNVHTAVAYSSAYRISVVPDLPFDQTVIYTEGEKFPAKSHEGALDKLTLLARQLKETLNRCVRGGENASTSYELPPPEVGKALGWVTSTQLGSVASSQVEFAADLANSASASKGAGMVGWTFGVAYAAGTVGAELNALAAQGQYSDTAGTAPAFTLTPTTPLTAYAAGVRYRVTFNADASAPTLNISSLGAIDVKRYDSTGAKVAAVVKNGMRSDVVYDGTDFVLLNPLAYGSLIGAQVFTSSGIYTKGTNNPSFVIVEGVGGGASGGVAWTSLTAAGIGASGGGGGGYFKKKILAASLATSVTVTIGNGGTGVSLSTSGATNGNGGGTTSFGTHCSATGGGAGQASRNTSATATSVAAAAGGLGWGGDFNTSGGSSQASFTYIKDSNVGSLMGGSGGGSLLGGGGPGLAPNGNTTTPSGYGGGSAGAVGTTGTVSTGDGAKGVVIVWEYA